MDKSIYRTIDANFNRSREGLRVCEDTARFILDDTGLTRRLKALRHEIESVLQGTPDLKKILLGSRDSRADVGKKSSSGEIKKTNAGAIFEANLERSKEAVRALEEYFKLVDKKQSQKFKKVRFALYSLEKGSFEKLETLRNIR